MLCPKISIVIPVYNSEKYLENCLNSILGQSYANLEIILVNDGSTDNSNIICKEFALKDERFFYYSQENKGVSATRNFGLSKASGDWIYFVDSDDSLLDNIFEDFISILFDNPQIDIYKFGYTIKKGKSKINIGDISSYLLYDTEDMYYKNELNSYYGFLWNTFFRYDIVSNIKFLEDISWCEDHIFSFLAFSKAKCMYISNKQYYLYNQDNIYSLSKKILNPYLIKKAAEEEFRVKKLCLTRSKPEVIDLLEKSFDSKIKFAIKNVYRKKMSFDERRKFYLEINYPFNCFIDSFEVAKNILRDIKYIFVK